MLTAVANYAKAQEIEPLDLAIPGPIIGKALYYGKCSVLCCTKWLLECTEMARICFLAPRTCAETVTEELPMNVG